MLQLFLKTLIFLEELRIPFTLYVDGAMQLPKIQLVVIRSVHKDTDGRATQVGAVADIRATLFEFWIEYK